MNDRKMIDVSVIVTVYNIEKYIEECLESILNQEGVCLECICVDDASTDGSYDILMEFARKDDRIKVIQNKKNMGLASSRNIGFRSAVGEYLYNIDGDDYLLPGALERLYICARENKLDLLGFSAISFFNDKKMESFFRGKDEYVRKGTYSGVMTGAELFSALINNGDRASSNMVLYFYRRDYFEENNLYAIEGLRYADDSMFAMYMAAQRAMCITDQLYMRRYREKSACTSPMEKRYLESMVVLFLEELQVWRSCNLNQELNNAIEKYFNMRQKSIRSFYNQFKNDETATSYLDGNVMAKYFYKYFIQEVPLYNDCLTMDEIRKIKDAEVVILYGAGYFANEVAKVLEYNEIQNYKVVVTSNEAEGKKFRGRDICSVYEVKTHRDKAFVLVAMSKINYDSVMQTLKALEFQNIHWVTL